MPRSSAGRVAGLTQAMCAALVVVDVGATGKVNTIYAATWGGGVVSTTWDTFSNRWTGFVRDSSGLTNWRVYSHWLRQP